MPHLQRVSLCRGRIIRDVADPIHSLHFPIAGMLGLLAVMGDGRTVVLAATGREGFLGVTAIFAGEAAPLRAIVLVEGDALNLGRSHLQRILHETPHFASALRDYANTYLAQVLRIGACHALHTVQQRVTFWLLMARDRSESDSLPFTHESLSELLGCRRPSVTEALSVLENAALIQRRRANIFLINREQLAMQALRPLPWCTPCLHRAHERRLRLRYCWLHDAGPCSRPAQVYFSSIKDALRSCRCDVCLITAGRDIPRGIKCTPPKAVTCKVVPHH